jgi:hypothetical protein
MRVGVLCEGSIDLPLIAALLQRIARVRGRIRWPIQPTDAIEAIRIPKKGFGQIEKALKHILANGDELAKYEFLIIVLDEKTRDTQARVRQLLRGKRNFALGIARREIEAWWLADRRNVLEWLGITEKHVVGTRYGQPYDAESDDSPKRTLDELTNLPLARVQSTYGDGNTDLALEFAESWVENANLGSISTACPSGFAPFLRRVEAFFHAAVRNRRKH